MKSPKCRDYTLDAFNIPCMFFAISTLYPSLLPNTRPTIAYTFSRTLVQGKLFPTSLLITFRLFFTITVRSILTLISYATEEYSSSWYKSRLYLLTTSLASLLKSSFLISNISLDGTLWKSESN